MTIASEVRKAGPYEGNGIATSFPFDFKVFSEDGILVTHGIDEGFGAIEEKVLELNVDYSVALNPDQEASAGGIITYPLSGDSLEPNEYLTFTGNEPYEQPTAITNQGGFYPRVIEDALDRAVIQIQQLQEMISRALLVPVSGGIVASELIDYLEEQLPKVKAVYDHLAELIEIVDNMQDVNTVAGSIDNVNLTGGSIVDVETVAADIVDVNTVAGISSDVQVVSSINVDVQDVAGIQQDVVNVSDIKAEVVEVAGIKNDVVNVSDRSFEISNIGRDLNGLPMVLDMGSIADPATNPAAPSGVLGAVWDNRDNIDIAADHVAQIQAVADNIQVIIDALQGGLRPSNNLSDLESIEQSLINLGLKDMGDLS